MELFCQKLEKWYLKLKENKLDLIDNTYLNSLFGINQTLSFENPNKNVFEGKMIGVSADGKLRIEVSNLDVKEFDIKEVKFLI